MTMSVIVDSSVALSWVLPDESRPKSNARRIVAQGGALAPAHWPLEVANGLQMALRRGRIDAAFRSECLRDLAKIPVMLDAQTGNRAWGETVRLADTHELTIYDAAYLELALRRNWPLATYDRALMSAAQRSGVVIV